MAPFLCLTAFSQVADDGKGAISGQKPPEEILVQLRPLQIDGRKALQAKDVERLDRVIEQMTSVLGSWAGIPETTTIYFPPTDLSPLDMKHVREEWFAELNRGVGSLPWYRNPEADPEKMRAGLREVALPLDALSRTALIYPERKVQLVDHITEGAHWLLRCQHPSGVFPFPVGPARNPRDKVGHIVANAVKERPDLVVKGWISDDQGDGGLQFDTGLCGKSLLSAWKVTGEARYLEGARRAGEWAMTCPLVSNWNYNAFSAGLLGRLYGATQEKQFLDAAIEKLSIGVLPGQMQGGRWFDGHNACAVYHNILLREMLEVLRVLPKDHSFRPRLADAVRRGLDQCANETLENGYSGTWSEVFALGIFELGENRLWRDAMNICVNAQGRNGAPRIGMSAVTILELLETPGNK